MQSLSIKNTKFQKQYQEWSYSWHQRRLSEINQRKQNNLSMNLRVIDSCRRNKFFNSRRKEIEKQESILYQNKKLLEKIANVKSSFYKSSSRHSILSGGSKQSERSMQQKQKNVQILKQNHEFRQKISQIKSTFRSIQSGRSSQRSQRKPIYNQDSVQKESKCLQVSKISQIKLMSIPSVKHNRYRNESSDNTGITQILPKINQRNYHILNKGRKSRQN